MEEFSIWALLSMAFGLGMMHALDADHVVAVSGLSARGGGWKSSVRFCLRWAIGHGGALMLIGIAVLFLGMAIPERLSHWAESGVGVILMLIGAWVILDLLRLRAHLHFHFHDDLPRHAHWHTHSTHESHHGQHHGHDHAPVMVGLLHGVAGSAPLLVILPLSQMGSPWPGFFYLLTFGVGVFIAMLLFGGALGGLFHLLQRWGHRLITGLRLLLGMGSILFGMHLLHGALS